MLLELFATILSALYLLNFLYAFVDILQCLFGFYIKFQMENNNIKWFLFKKLFLNHSMSNFKIVYVKVNHQ